MNELEVHLGEYHWGFQQPPNKICRYFLNGGCSKGRFCRFTHPQEKQERRVPHCRHGNRCRYLAQGVCSFFHRGYGVQQQKTKDLCNYMEDCVRVPNCPFAHSDQDFPKLTKTNHPPSGVRVEGWWADY